MLCDYCGRAPITAHELCSGCLGRFAVRLMYARQTEAPRPPGWKAHLRRLAERARQRLPLFETRGGSEGLCG